MYTVCQEILTGEYFRENKNREDMGVVASERHVN